MYTEFYYTLHSIPTTSHRSISSLTPRTKLSSAIRVQSSLHRSAPNFRFSQSQDKSRAHSPSFHRFTNVTAHSPTLPSLYLRHSSFSNPSVASPTSQLILQPFFFFSYATGFHLRDLASRPHTQWNRILISIAKNSLVDLHSNMQSNYHEVQNHFSVQ